jgi:hypothetical protein
MSRLQLALDQIVLARDYTKRLLDHVAESDWFRQPHDGVTHIAWQVGHLAMAQHRLALDRVRGPRPEDAALISEEFMRPFARESVPDPDPANYPPIAEIRAVLDRVHEQVLRELPTLTDADLDQPVLKPHPIAKTKFLSLLWCAQHELIHAGQIGLLRRLLGHRPLW